MRHPASSNTGYTVLENGALSAAITAPAARMKTHTIIRDKATPYYSGFSRSLHPVVLSHHKDAPGGAAQRVDRFAPFPGLLMDEKMLRGRDAEENAEKRDFFTSTEASPQDWQVMTMHRPKSRAIDPPAHHGFCASPAYLSLGKCRVFQIVRKPAGSVKRDPRMKNVATPGRLGRLRRSRLTSIFPLSVSIHPISGRASIS